MRFSGKKFFRWFIILSSFIALQNCGKPSAMEASLQIPAGVDADRFWENVTQKSLRVSPKEGEPQEFPWEGQHDIPLREGDKLTFLGKDDVGNILVTGETEVGPEKKATIAIRRVL